MRRRSLLGEQGRVRANQSPMTELASPRDDIKAPTARTISGGNSETAR